MMEWLRTSNEPVFRIEVLNDASVPDPVSDLLFICMKKGVARQDVQAMLQRCGDPKWVMVSSDPADGIIAFDLGAIDLLLRPIQFDRFKKCLARIRRILAPASNDAIKRSGPALHEIVLKSGKGFVSVAPAKIQLIQGMGNYTKLHLGDTHVLVSSTMANLIELLPVDRFVRIHRSFIINIDHIRSIGANTIEWTGGEIALGSVFKKQALAKLRQRLSKG